MSHPNKRKGSKFETDLVRAIRDAGFSCERLHVSGAQDEGDLVVQIASTPYVIEAKAERQMDLAGYVAEAATEANHYRAHRGLTRVRYAAVVKRRNRSIMDAYVVMPLREWLEQIDHHTD